MRLTARQYGTILISFLEKHGPSLETASAFLSILRKNHQERLFGRILMIAESILEEHCNEVNVKAIVAKELTENQTDEMVAHLEKSFDKKVHFAQIENPEVKGGIALRVGDSLYDATLRGALNRLKKQLEISL